MGNLNKVMLIGRLGQEPEKKVTTGGHSVVTLSLATSEKFTDKGGNKQEKTEWHRVTFWNQAAEIIERYLHKGSQLYVEGSLTTREWTDKEGNKRWTTEISGQNFQFLDPPQAKAGAGAGQSYGQPAAQQGGGYNQPPAQQGGGYGQPAQQGGNYGGPGAPQGNPQGSPQGGAPAGFGGNEDFIEDDIPF